MKTISDLEEIRIKTLNQIRMRTDGESVRIVVGMATCGIASGAREVMNAFLKEIKNQDLHNVYITASGCVEDCKLEPVVNLIDKDGKKVTYVNMNPEKAVKVVEEHILKDKVCSEYTINQ